MMWHMWQEWQHPRDTGMRCHICHSCNGSHPHSAPSATREMNQPGLAETANAPLRSAASKQPNLCAQRSYQVPAVL
jgi:hypothetical protein